MSNERQDTVWDGGVLVTHDGAAAAAAPSLIEGMVPFVVLIAIFYFLMVRPQQQKDKEHRELIASLKKDDRVVTSGGLHGRIVEISGEVLTMESGAKTRLVFDRTAIARRLQSKDEPSSDSNA